MTNRGYIRHAMAMVACNPRSASKVLVSIGLAISSLLAYLLVSDDAVQQVASDFRAIEWKYVDGELVVPATPNDLSELEVLVRGVDGIEAYCVWANEGTGELARVNELSPEIVPVFAVQGDCQQALGIELVSGRYWSDAEISLGLDMALLGGSDPSWRIGMQSPDQQVVLDGRPYGYVGEVIRTVRHPQLATGVMLQASQFREDTTFSTAHITVLASDVEEREGIAEALERITLLSGNRVEARPVIRGAQLRSLIDNSLQGSFIIGAVAFVILSLILTLLSVRIYFQHRVAEFGLRRSMGCTSGQMRREIALEAIVLGMLGGLVASLFTGVAILAAHLSDRFSVDHGGYLWMPIVAGAALSFLFAFPTALKATQIDPSVAMKVDNV